LRTILYVRQDYSEALEQVLTECHQQLKLITVTINLWTTSESPVLYLWI